MVPDSARAGVKMWARAGAGAGAGGRGESRGRASMGVATAVKRSAAIEAKSQYGIHLIW